MMCWENHGATTIEPIELAQQFLGVEIHLEGPLPKRFGSHPIWRVRHRLRNEEVYYLKIADLHRQEANQIAGVLLALRERGLPVALWLPLGKDYSIGLNPSQCAVMETSLPGRAVAYEDQSDGQLEASARMLARLHTALAEITFAEGPFRAEFPTGLRAFGKLVDEIQCLVSNAQNYPACDREDKPQFNNILRWLDEHSPAILLSTERVRNELRVTLNTVGHQLVFGDFNCRNVLFNSDGAISGVIDYEDFHHGPRELDALSHCMFGTLEPHFPTRLGRFRRAYTEEASSGLNLRAMGPIARALSYAQLIRSLHRALSSASIAPGTLDLEVIAKLNRVNQLCIDLAVFEVSDKEEATWNRCQKV